MRSGQSVLQLSTFNLQLSPALSVEVTRGFNRAGDKLPAMAVQPIVVYRPLVRQRRPRNPVGYFALCALSTAVAMLAAPAADRVLAWLGGS